MKLHIEPQHVSALAECGAVAWPALSAQELVLLQHEAHQLPLHGVEDITGTGVEQHFQAAEGDDIPPNSMLRRVACSLEREINEALFVRECVLTEPFRYNDMAVQVYPPALPGQRYAISPHVDHKECVGLIAIVVIEGVAPFCVCDNKAGDNTREISSEPGDIILIRGYGYLGKARPCHFVGRVLGGTRISLGLRQLVGSPVLSHRAQEGA